MFFIFNFHSPGKKPWNISSECWMSVYSQNRQWNFLYSRSFECEKQQRLGADFRKWKYKLEHEKILDWIFVVYFSTNKTQRISFSCFNFLLSPLNVCCIFFYANSSTFPLFWGFPTICEKKAQFNRVFVKRIEVKTFYISLFFSSLHNPQQLHPSTNKPNWINLHFFALRKSFYAKIIKEKKIFLSFGFDFVLTMALH